MDTNSDAAILGRLIEAGREGLIPAAARYLLLLDFPSADRDRMDELAARAREGTITADEAAELESYVRIGHLLALLQSKARTSLKRGGFAA